MDDYVDSNSRIETLINAAQVIKEILICRICLQTFKEPITLRCGHKFCRDCILKVTNINAYAKCPFCKIKIQKRSIPKKGNDLLQTCVDKFNALVQAIKSDSDIDVLHYCNKLINTCENVALSNKPSNSKIEETSTTSTSSSLKTSHKLKYNSQKKTKPSLSLKATYNETKKNTNENHALHKYLSKKENSIPDQMIHTSEKVEHWLKNVSLRTENEASSNSNENDSSKECVSTNNISNLTFDTEGCENKKSDEFNKKESGIQEVQKKVKKSKTILKIPGSVTPVLHSDDWHRLKKVNREMNPKVFKSLPIKIEKKLSASALDDTVPYDSTNSTNMSRIFHDVDHSFNNTSKSKKQLSKINNDSVDASLESHKKKSYSDNCMDKKKESIGILSMKNVLNTPEKTRNESNLINGATLELNQLSLLNKTNDSLQDELSEEDSNIDSKIIIHNPSNSSPKHRLSLKKTHASTIHKLENLQNNAPVKLNHTENNIPERPKSRLSLHLSTPRTSEPFTNNSPVKRHSSKNNILSLNYNSNKKEIHSPRRKFVTFRKLGSICKKRKCIPFLKLSNLKPRNRVILYKNIDKETSGIVIKSNIPVKINYKSVIKNSEIDLKVTHANTNNRGTNTVKLLSPEKDSQLKYLSIESPHPDLNKTEKNDATNKDNFDCNSKQPPLNTSMEIDEFPTNLDNKMLEPDLNFRDEVRANNDISETNKVIDENFTIDTQIKTSNSSSQNVIREIDDTNVTEQGNSVNIHACVKETYDVLNDFNSELSKISKKSEQDANFNKLENNEIINPVQRKTNEVNEDTISSSSKESSSKDTDTASSNSQKSTDKESAISTTINKNAYSYQESKRKSELSIASEGKSKNSENNNSYSTNASSCLNASSLKNKRKHSETSNDDDDNDVSFIIGKWCETAAPIEKKAKVSTSSSIENNVKFDRIKKKSLETQGMISECNENTVVDDKYSELHVPQRDSPIDDIIAYVKSFKENETDRSKLNIVPNTLLSADLFESNDLPAQPKVQTSPKILNDFNSSISSISICSPKIKIDKENLFEVTMMDPVQFDENKLNLSKNSDSSNKENITRNHTIPSTPSKLEKTQRDKVNKIESYEKDVHNETNNQIIGSEIDSYHVSESLLNITQEQLALKKLENDLLGVDLSILNDKKQDICKDNFSTPHRNIEVLQKNTITDDNSDNENIAATPVSRRRQIPGHVSRKSNSKRESELNTFSPEHQKNLIPAVTPVKNTRSYPLSHSTPHSLNLGNKLNTSRKITLVCSGLRPENIKVVQSFARKFYAGFQNNFSMDVSHVIVQTDLETKAGQKTFKYIQGVAFKKHVISFQWIVDCLKENNLLNEDDDKYEVLDPDTLECGSKKSINRNENIFSDFAFFCVEPFNSFSLVDFKNLLKFNGATITSTTQELSLQKNKYRVVILESENLSQKQLSMLKESQGVLISFEWIVDSISQYQILPLVSYLSATTVDEAIALGFPPEYFVEEDDESQ